MPAEHVLGVYRFGPGGLIFVHNFENEGIMVVLIGSRYKNHRPKKTSAVKRKSGGFEPLFFLHFHPKTLGEMLHPIMTTGAIFFLQAGW